jgi:hypothetical protein
VLLERILAIDSFRVGASLSFRGKSFGGSAMEFLVFRAVENAAYSLETYKTEATL